MRAFALGALGVLVGAIAFVGGFVSWGWGIAGAVVGALLMLGGMGLLLAAVLAARAQSVTVTLDEMGFRVLSPGGREHSGAWARVTRVTGAPGRITIHEGDCRTHLIAPAGSDANMDDIAAAIERHLDLNRGYTAYTESS